MKQLLKVIWDDFKILLGVLALLIFVLGGSYITSKYAYWHYFYKYGHYDAREVAVLVGVLSTVLLFGLACWVGHVISRLKGYEPRYTNDPGP